MLNKNDIIEIKIDSLANGGEGVGKYNGMAVFVPNSAPGDLLRAKINYVSKKYAKAVNEQLLKPSSYRIEPTCKLSKVCGGCDWQHIEYQYQLKAKQQIVKETLNRMARFDIPVNDVIHSESNLNYRCKVQYPISQTKVSKRFLAGYYKKATHEIVNIKHCPIQPDLIDQITEFIRLKAQELNISSYSENKHKGILRHLVFRYSYTNKDVQCILVINAKSVPNIINELADHIKSQFSQISGVLANINTSKTNVILGPITHLITGKDHIEENIEGRKFKISAGSFFQVNVSSAVKMFNYVENIVKSKMQNPDILDVYAGVGSFTVWLKDCAKKITAIEEFPAAVTNANENLELNNANNIEFLQGNADDVLKQLSLSDFKYDITVLDPPRKGCSKEALESAVKLTKNHIIYVSCNPSTLARDINILKEHGFIPESVQPIDMFCHTSHIESVVVLNKH